MEDYLTITMIVDEIYTRHFDLHGDGSDKDCFNGETVHFFMECSKNNDSHRNDDYYSLDIYFSVGDYANREYLIGVSFGHKGMSQEEIDKELVSWIKSQLDYCAPFSRYVSDYLKKEELMENWLDEHSEPQD